MNYLNISLFTYMDTQYNSDCKYQMESCNTYFTDKIKTIDPYVDFLCGYSNDYKSFFEKSRKIRNALEIIKKNIRSHALIKNMIEYKMINFDDVSEPWMIFITLSENPSNSSETTIIEINLLDRTLKKNDIKIQYNNVDNFYMRLMIFLSDKIKIEFSFKK